MTDKLVSGVMEPSCVGWYNFVSETVWYNGTWYISKDVAGRWGIASEDASFMTFGLDILDYWYDDLDEGQNATYYPHGIYEGNAVVKKAPNPPPDRTMRGMGA